MSKLRDQMIRAMRQRGFSERTHESYLYAVTDLARYYRQSPDQLGADEVQAWLRYLAVDRGLSGSSCRVYLHGVRFLYRKVLERSDFELNVELPKRAQRIPELLTRDEVGRILLACRNDRHHALLATCYGCGLRVGELTRLRVRNIDGERGLLRIEQGKGGKDRLVPMGNELLVRLRDYWRKCRPQDWLFPQADDAGRPLTSGTCRRAYGRAKERAGIAKTGGIHALRHAYATHQLRAGLPLQDLQHYLGHTSIRTTMGYLHWIPDYREGHGQHDLLARLPAQAVHHG